jgi:predicted nucleic acid-binding protein
VIWLLDTNVIVHALYGVPQVRDRVNAVAPSDRLMTSTIFVAELVYGAECSARREEIVRTSIASWVRSRLFP